MLNRLHYAVVLSVSCISFQVYAWDPWGDITHPDRIIDNIERETRNAGRQIDRARIEANAQAGAPILQNWFIESRDTAIYGASPIPLQIRNQLTGFYDEDLLNRVRFKIGDAGTLNLANLSIQYGDADAVTLIDVVVFKNKNDAYNNPTLWAHELKHVQQFREWGVRNFSIRYIRSWNSVENEAYDAENMFARTNSQTVPSPRIPQVDSQIPQATPQVNPRRTLYCCSRITNLRTCQTQIVGVIGNPCQCRGLYDTGYVCF